jgi:ribosomal protein S18 acetylase RimI-like enzyme
MLKTYRAQEADAALISDHRVAMFSSMGGTPASVLDVMRGNFEPWVARMIREDRYLGWITRDGDCAVASAGMLILDWPPHPRDPIGESRAYLLNVYVDPDHRRQGLARSLVETCMAEAHRRGIRVVSLHASDAGRSLYETMGFRASNEMIHDGRPMD